MSLKTFCDRCNKEIEMGKACTNMELRGKVKEKLIRVNVAVKCDDGEHYCDECILELMPMFYTNPAQDDPRPDVYADKLGIK